MEEQSDTGGMIELWGKGRTFCTPQMDGMVIEKDYKVIRKSDFFFSKPAVSTAI